MFFDQHAFESIIAFSGLGDRMVQFVLSDPVVCDQKIEFGRILFRVFRRLKKAMPSALAISATDSSSFRVKRLPAFLVEELEDSHQIFIVGDDRIGQDLFCLESGPFIVGCVVEQ